jgi:hypothetical protein
VRQVVLGATLVMVCGPVVARAGVPVGKQVRAVVQRAKTGLLRLKADVQQRRGERSIAKARKQLKAIGMDPDTPVFVRTPHADRQIAASLFKEEQLLRGAKPGTVAARRHAAVKEQRETAHLYNHWLATAILPPGAAGIAHEDGKVFIHAGVTKTRVGSLSIAAHELRHVKEIPKNLKRLGEGKSAEDWIAATADAEVSAARGSGYALGRTGHSIGSEHMRSPGTPEDATYPPHRISNAVVAAYLNGAKDALGRGRPLTRKAQAYLSGFGDVLADQGRDALDHPLSREDVEALQRWVRQQPSPTLRERLRDWNRRFVKEAAWKTAQRLERLATPEAAYEAGRLDAGRLLSPLGRARELRRSD